MASSSEDIAKRMADLKARRRYWPEGEPGSRRGRDRDRDRGRSKHRDETDPGERKASTDLKFKRKLKAEPEKFEPISEFVRKERARRFERALKEIEEKRAVPKDVPLKKWLNEPGNLRRAVKRGMVKKIAKHANPKSRDTEDVVTVGGSRYAKTDLYQAPIRERASEIVLKTKFGSEMWWDKNKKVVFVAAVSLVAGFMAYTVWKNKELQQNVARQRTRRHALVAHPKQHTGFLSMPASAHGGGAGAGRGAGGGALGHGGGAASVFHGQSGAFHGQSGAAAFAHQGHGERRWDGWGGSGGWGEWDAYPSYTDQYSWDPYDSYEDPFAFWW